MWVQIPLLSLTQVDNALERDVVMPMYNQIYHCNNYTQKSESLWQCQKDKPNDNMTDSQSLQVKAKITVKTVTAGNTKDV